ncbi:MAG: hypothetical protein NTW99_07775 [Chloroflexi bacterium]|nr:hypothetical protein [Chloroflexota bacterium]
MTNLVARLDLPEAHTRALAALLEYIPPAEFLWALTGSAGLRLQGVDVPVHDLDIQTEEKTVYLIEQRLAGSMKTAVQLWESPGMRSLDGKAEVEGIEIELLANIAHKMPDGTWRTYTDFFRLVWVDMHGLRVPTFLLEDELEAYEAMGRSEKAALIRKTLASLFNS